MIELRDEYVTRFGALAGVELCAAHDGEFRADEVARLGAAKTPAVYVACAGMEREQGYDGPLIGALSWVAFVVVRSPDAVREEQRTAGDLAGVISLAIVYELLRGTAFAHGAEQATKVRARNLFGTSAAKSGFILWAVTWIQSAEILPDAAAPVYANFRRMVADFDLPPEDGVDLTGEADLPPPE